MPDQFEPHPPANLEAEEYVLGAIMLSPYVADVVRPILQPSDFYRESHGRIYRAALDMADQGAPIDVLTLIDELEKRGQLVDVGGRDRLREIATLVPATTNAGKHAELVASAARFRQIIHTGEAITRIGWDPEGDLDEKYARARQLADQLDEPRVTALEVESWHRFESQAHAEIPVLIDRLWPEAAFGFIGAPPKKGKTWVALAVAIAIAAGKPLFDHFTVPKPRPVLYVALEGHRAALRARVGALAHGMGIDPDTDELDNLHWLYKPRGINLADPAWAYKLRQAAGQIDAAIVIVDVLRASARIKENDQESFGQLRANLQPITDDGRAIAMLHHNTKLSEISKERAPGERLSGSGAMFGALDVGIYITGSQNHATELRLAFDLRDLATPNDISINLEGEGTGSAGGYSYHDTATWRIVEEDAGVAEDDLKMPALEIYDWLVAHGGQATSVEICAANEIVDRTLRRREERLKELGIEITRKRGKSTVYKVGEPSSDASWSDTPDTLFDTVVRGVEETRMDAQTPRTPDTPDTSPTSAVSGVEPLNHAGLPDTPDTPDKPGVPTSESADMQGKSTPDTPDSPTESAHARAREAHPEAPDIAWPTNGNGHNQIASAELELGEDELARLESIATDGDIDWTRP